MNGKNLKNRRRVFAARAFTLIELLLVLVIIAVLAAVVVPKMVGRTEDAKIKATVGSIGGIKTALETFEVDNGRFPTSKEGLMALVNAPGGLTNWHAYVTARTSPPTHGVTNSSTVTRVNRTAAVSTCSRWDLMVARAATTTLQTGKARLPFVSFMHIAAVKSRPAFTLLELVVVLLVITIAMGIVAPQLRGWNHGAKLRDTGEQFITLARLARTQAAATGQVHRLVVGSDGRCAVSVQDGEQFLELGAPYEGNFAVPEGVSIKLTDNQNVPRDFVEFYPNGRPSPVRGDLHERRHGPFYRVRDAHRRLPLRGSGGEPMISKRHARSPQCAARPGLYPRRGPRRPGADGHHHPRRHAGGATLAMRSASLARHQAEAATLGEARLSEMVAQGDWASAGSQGDFGTDFPQYRWTLQNKQNDMDITELMLTVNWTERGQEHAMNLSTFVYVSANPDTGNGTGTGTGAGARHDPPPRRQTGFTLIELILAMTMVAMLALTLYMSLSIAVKAKRSAFAAMCRFAARSSPPTSCARILSPCFRQRSCLPGRLSALREPALILWTFIAWEVMRAGIRRIQSMPRVSN